MFRCCSRERLDSHQAAQCFKPRHPADRPCCGIRQAHTRQCLAHTTAVIASSSSASSEMVCSASIARSQATIADVSRIRPVGWRMFDRPRSLFRGHPRTTGRVANGKERRPFPPMSLGVIRWRAITRRSAGRFWSGESARPCASPAPDNRPMPCGFGSADHRWLHTERCKIRFSGNQEAFTRTLGAIPRPETDSRTSGVPVHRRKSRVPGAWTGRMWRARRHRRGSA